MILNYRFRAPIARVDSGAVSAPTVTLPWMTWMANDTAPDWSSVRFTLPGTLDPNHLNGIGALRLLAHLPIGVVGSPGTLNLNGGKVRIRARLSPDFQANGNALRIWICSNFAAGENAPLNPTQISNWCFTAKDLLADFSSSFAVGETVLGLDGWTYAGVNMVEQGEANAQRYAARPNDPKASIENVSATLHICFVGPRSDIPPTGSIDIDYIEIEAANTPTPPVASVAAAFAQSTTNNIALAMAALWRAGNTEAASYFGYWLFNGVCGLMRDPAGAYPALVASCGSYPRAAATVAKAYACGEGIPRDEAYAREFVLPFPNDPSCCYVLGTMMLNGIGGPVDLPGGRDLLTFAAGHMTAGEKNPNAMLDIARYYLRPTPEFSYSWGYIWLRRAQMSGISGPQAMLAQQNLAYCQTKMPAGAAADLEQSAYLVGWAPTPV